MFIHKTQIENTIKFHLNVREKCFTGGENFQSTISRAKNRKAACNKLLER